MAKEKKKEAPEVYTPYFWKDEILPDVYTYDLPTRMRNQIYALFNDAFSYPERTPWGDNDFPGVVYREVIHDLERLIGFDARASSGRGETFKYTIREHTNIREVLTAVELSARKIQKYYTPKAWGAEREGRRYIQDLNQIFGSYGVGYQFESGHIVPRQSEFIHREVTRPALGVLADPRFATANEEFLKAYERFQAQDYENCHVECTKAFESTLKIICHIRGWPHDANAAASKLVEVVLSNNLVPSFSRELLTGIRQTLAGGVPVIRNKKGGHGGGVAGHAIPKSLAAYQLHLAATVILYLFQAHQEMPVPTAATQP